MSVLQESWLTTSSSLAAIALLVVLSVIVMRAFRAWRSRKQDTRHNAFRTSVLLHITARADGPTSEAILASPNFVAVAPSLLTQVDDASRKYLIDLMRRHEIDDHFRRGLRHLNRAKRIAAAEALRFFPSHETRNALLRTLRDKDVDMRLAAAASLIHLDAAPPL